MSASPLTVGGWYGRVGVEILRGSHCVAVVGRVQSNRLAHLDTVRSANAKRGEQAHLAEAEAKELERFEALGLARQFAAAPELLAALKRGQGTSACGECLELGRVPCIWCEASAAIAKAEGRS